MIERSFVEAHNKQFDFVQKIDGGVDAAGAQGAFELYRFKQLKVESLTFSGVSSETLPNQRHEK